MRITNFDQENKMITIMFTGIVSMHTVHLLFVTIHLSALIVKPAGLVEPQHLIPTLLMGSCRATPA